MLENSCEPQKEVIMSGKAEEVVVESQGHDQDGESSGWFADDFQQAMVSFASLRWTKFLNGGNHFGVLCTDLLRL